MKAMVSSNTKAILLLTAPLIVGREKSSIDLLTLGEYNQLARVLNKNNSEPRDLLESGANELFIILQNVVDGSRLKNLLGRGFLLSQAIERWDSRSIWVISRADADYPKRLKERLKDKAPTILFGSGDNALLELGGLAIVGSRNVEEKLIEYTENIGRLAAKAHQVVISGGARGIDRAAMFSSLQCGGRVIGILADNLERLALARDTREYLMDNKLVLISPYDPAVGFDVGNAMQRNKIIYALADAALVVNSDYEKGGTWAGATEQLDKLHLVPVYIRFSEDAGNGLKALRQKGALLWPNPDSSEEFIKTLSIQTNQIKDELIQTELPLATNDKPEKLLEIRNVGEKYRPQTPSELTKSIVIHTKAADELFAKVKEIILKMNMPVNEAEVAEDLQVSKKQAKDWLRRLEIEGSLKKKRKLPGYIIAL